MIKYSVYFFIVNAFISYAIGESCIEPKVTSKTFTTQDATVVTNIAYISEFNVECGTGAISNLYADIDGNIQPVSLIGPNSYQVSWTEEIPIARSGDRIVNVYDEEGYTALRKAIRNGEDLSTISELFKVTVNHPGAFTGPWLKSEFLAAILSVVVAYIAFSSRSKLLS